MSWQSNGGASPRFLLACILSFILLFGITACGCGGPSDGAGTLQVNGSTTVTPIVQAWAEEFNRKHSGEVIIQGTGSGDGIAALINGQTEIAMTSRKMRDSEREKIIERHNEDPKEWIIARDALAIVIHPDNPVQSLTLEQIKGIFTGEIENWSEVGGDDAPISVFTRDSSSGTFVFFQNSVLDGQDYLAGAQKTASNAALAGAVAQDKTAIGYAGLAFVDESVKTVSVAPSESALPVKPTFEAAKEGEYPIVRDLNMYTVGEISELARAFLEFGLSEEGQEAVREVGYVPIR